MKNYSCSSPGMYWCVLALSVLSRFRFSGGRLEFLAGLVAKEFFFTKSAAYFRMGGAHPAHLVDKSLMSCDRMNGIHVPPTKPEGGWVCAINIVLKPTFTLSPIDLIVATNEITTDQLISIVHSITLLFVLQLHRHHITLFHQIVLIQHISDLIATFLLLHVIY